MRVVRTPEQNAPAIMWTKQCNCPMCNATLEYTNLDVKKREIGPNEIGDVLICGYCNKWFTI